MLFDRTSSQSPLPQASKTLSVVRRRIYDVVNVLQSIGVVSRRGKNSYDWIGAKGLREAVAEVGGGRACLCFVFPHDAVLQIRQGDSDSSGGKQKRGESLGALSRKFVGLFIGCEPGTILR